MAVTTTDDPRRTHAPPTNYGATEVGTERGVSLSRGPALYLGTILLVACWDFICKQHTFLKFSNFPSGNAPVQAKVLDGIFGVNGWSGMFTAAAGGLLLFGAAEHMLAKTMSLIVGIALGAAAIIALVSGNVLGMAAANHWTELLWGVSAVILLFNVAVPRRTRTVPVEAGQARAGVGCVATGRKRLPLARSPVRRPSASISATSRNGATVRSPRPPAIVTRPSATKTKDTAGAALAAETRGARSSSFRHGGSATSSSTQRLLTGTLSVCTGGGSRLQ